MGAKRLTKSQKVEILEGYKDGETSQPLAEKYSCSPNTISRTVKSLISVEEYNLLKEARLKDTKNIARKMSIEIKQGADGISSEIND